MSLSAWIIFPLLGYLAGSLPFALWITRLVKGVDVREVGSGHVTTTNTIRQAGWLPGIAVGLLDISKGYLPTFLALRSGSPDLVVVLTTTMAVIGHCWPIFSGFRGGMGLAAAGGGYLAVAPLGFVIGVAVVIVLLLVIRHAARAAFFAAFLIPVVLWVLGMRGLVLYLSVGTGIVLAARFASDWNRKYRELWLDREKEET